MGPRNTRYLEKRILESTDRLIECAIAASLLENEAKEREFRRGVELIAEISSHLKDLIEVKDEYLPEVLNQIISQKMPDNKVQSGLGTFNEELERMVQYGLTALAQKPAVDFEPIQSTYNQNMPLEDDQERGDTEQLETLEQTEQPVQAEGVEQAEPDIQEVPVQILEQESLFDVNEILPDFESSCIETESNSPVEAAASLDEERKEEAVPEHETGILEAIPEPEEEYEAVPASAQVYCSAEEQAMLEYEQELDSAQVAKSEQESESKEESTKPQRGLDLSLNILFPGCEVLKNAGPKDLSFAYYLPEKRLVIDESVSETEYRQKQKVCQNADITYVIIDAEAGKNPRRVERILQSRRIKGKGQIKL